MARHHAGEPAAASVVAVFSPTQGGDRQEVRAFSCPSTRLTDDLRDNDVKAGRHRVARLMREAGIRAKKPPRWKKTTNSKHDLPRAPNIVERRWDELATAPNKLWVSDLTYIWTWQGWVYLVVFLDVFSRKVVGWKVDETMEAHVVTDALKIAMTRRSPTRGLILHSDQGSQYASNLYRTLIEQSGFQRSMSRKGDCWDTQSRMGLEFRIPA